MRKTIVVVGSSLSDKGGIVTVMKNIEESNLQDEFKFNHIDTYITGSIIEKIKMYFSGIINLIRTIKKENVDLIHIHMSYKGSFYRKSIIILICSIMKIPIILHIHGSCFKEFYNGLNKIGKKYCKYILNKVDKLIVLSKSWRDFFKEFVEIDRIEVINNCVPVNKKNKVFLENKNKLTTFIFMGRLGNRKGVYDLLDVAKMLYCSGYKDKFKIILAGDGEINEVNKIITENSLEDIVINKGWISGDEKESLLTHGNVFVLPSYNEGLPMAILEAMSYKLMCISTNVGGIPEVIEDGVNGFIIEPGDINQLYSNMVKCIENERKVSKMSENAWNHVYENFNQDKQLCKFKEIYLNNIQNKK